MKRYLLLSIMFLLHLPLTMAQNEVREVARLGRGVAHTLAWRPDGKMLVVGSGTGVWLLDEDLNSLENHEVIDTVTQVAWHPSSTQIALSGTINLDCYTQLWDSEFSKLLLDVEFCTSMFLWSPDGTRLAMFGDYSGKVLLVNTLDKSVVAEISGHSGTWLADGRFITATQFTGGYYGEIGTFIWNGETGNELGRLETPEYGYKIEPMIVDEKTMVVRCREIVDDLRVRQQLCLQDILTGEIIEFIVLGSRHVGDNYVLSDLHWNNFKNRFAYNLNRWHKGFLDSLIILNLETQETKTLGNSQAYTWKPNANIITNVVGNGFIQNINVNSGEVLIEEMLFTAPIQSITWRPEHHQIASSGFGYGQFIRVWESSATSYAPDLIWQTETAEFVQYTPDGSELITGGTITTDTIVNHDIQARDADTVEFTRHIEGFYSQFESLPITAWNSDFTRSAKHIGQNIIQVTEDITITPSWERLRDIYWSPDDQLIATVSQVANDFDFIVEIWNVDTGQFIQSVQGHMQGFNDLVWSPDSTKFLVIGSRRTGGGSLVRNVSIYSVAVNYNYSMGDSDIEWFDWANYPTNSSLTPIQVSWSKNGEMIAISLVDGIHIHYIENDHELAIIPSPDTTALDWSSDSRFLASGSINGLIRIWDMSQLTSVVQN